MGYNIETGGTGGGSRNNTSAVITPVRVTGIILDENHERWQSLGGWDSLGCSNCFGSSTVLAISSVKS